MAPPAMHRPRAACAALSISAAMWLAAGAIASSAMAQPGPRPVAGPTPPGAGRTSLFGNASGPAWTGLSAGQRTALAPLATAWPTIDAEQKHRWLILADRYPTVPASEQARIQARMTEWARMTPQQRGQTRLHFKEAQHLSPGERQARWTAYQALPPEQRRALAERASSAGSASRATAGRQAVAADHARTEGLPHAGDRPPRLQPVAPAIVKAGPGATTTLITRTGGPPAHQRPGMPKIAVGADDVNGATLLPKRGAQSATSVSTAAQASAAAPRRP